MIDPIETAFHTLEALDLSAIESTGDWELGRMFSHLAQGVTFSIDGYPIQKPRAFQATVGTLAFKVFEMRGRMSHGLNDPIPGEVIAQNLTADDGLQQLWKALERFRGYDGPLQPHFAFGALAKPQFAKAHLFHLNNHLDEVQPRKA